MKKFLIFLGICFLVFIGLTYWSVSIGPSEIKISEVIVPQKPTGKELRRLQVVEVIPTNQYASNKVKRFMQGENYRRIWKEPVAAEILWLDSFRVVEEGGGNQTKSLKIKNSDSILYSLRSINKDPDPLIPGIAKVLNLENIVVDGVSAQHPYGALLAASLADAAGILHTHPRIVYVPEQPELGAFADEYSNRLYLLEYETEGEVNWTSIPNVVKIVETDDLQEMKERMGDTLTIDKRQLVRARLFDLLIGDWDRHAKQWGWVLQKRGEEIKAIPLPGDRDNAFFRIDGVIPTVITNELVQPMVRPFEKDIDHIPGFVYPFDLYFLNDIPEKVFLEEAKVLQTRLSDDKIEQALEEWPGSVIQFNREEIFEKLKHRRNKLPQYAREFSRAIKKIEEKSRPLKGSEDLDLKGNLEKCFECE